MGNGNRATTFTLCIGGPASGPTPHSVPALDPHRTTPGFCVAHNPRPTVRIATHVAFGHRWVCTDLTYFDVVLPQWCWPNHHNADLLLRDDGRAALGGRAG